MALEEEYVRIENNGIIDEFIADLGDVPLDGEVEKDTRKTEFA